MRFFDVAMSSSVYGEISDGVERMGDQRRTEKERGRPRRALLRVLSEIAETASYGTPTRAATPAVAAHLLVRLLAGDTQKQAS